MSRSLRTSRLWFLVAVISFLCCVPTCYADDAAPGAGALPPGTTGTIDISANDIEVVKVLRMIAEHGYLEIIIGDDVTGILKRVTMKKVTPEAALQRVSRAAELTWQRMDNGVFIIQKMSRNFTLSKTQSFNFEASDLPYQEVFNRLAQISGTKILWLAGLSSKLKYIRLNNTTVENAVDTITRAAGLKWQKTTHGEIVIFGGVPIIGRVPMNPSPRALPPTTEPMPPGAWPFQFNGQTVYHIPLH